MRISRHQMFMDIAVVVSRRSTCYRRSVGAVLVADKRVVSIGYNGPPAGEPHCTGHTCAGHAGAGCTRSVHAEINALAAEHGNGATALYVTESPCADCATLLVDLRPYLRSVFFLNRYRVEDGIVALGRRGISVFQMTTSGYIMDAFTGDMIDESIPGSPG